LPDPPVALRKENLARQRRPNPIAMTGKTMGLLSLRPVRAFRVLLIASLVALMLAGPAVASVRIASWNLKHAGWDNGKNLQVVAAVIDRFDLVAIQELMYPDTAKKLARIVSKRSGEPWGVVVS